MIFIDYKDARPIYEQIVQAFERHIINGVLETDSKMPSVRSLAMELSINPNTIQKSYEELERRGYIYTVKGKGSFVADCSELSELQRSNCINNLQKVVREAKGYGITKEEIYKAIDGVME